MTKDGITYRWHPECWQIYDAWHIESLLLLDAPPQLTPAGWANTRGELLGDREFRESIDNAFEKLQLVWSTLNAHKETSEAIIVLLVQNLDAQDYEAFCSSCEALLQFLSLLSEARCQSTCHTGRYWGNFLLIQTCWLTLGLSRHR